MRRMSPLARWDTDRTTKDWVRAFMVLGLLGTLLSGCNSGGGGEADPPSEALTAAEQSSRFLAQAALGANMEEVDRVTALGFESWLDEQLAMAPQKHLPTLDRLVASYGDLSNNDTTRSPAFRRLAWWERVLDGEDVLRQRVAMALSEIFVISELMDVLRNNPRMVASYYDMLLENSFGSFEDLLLAVTLHPAMGIYLSHLNNDRSDSARGRFPDESYAREVMQLFSIGLFELGPDGEVLTDASGQPIPTYDNTEITEFAKVFTGLGLQGPGASFGGPFGDRTLPMVMYEDHHEPGEKVLLGGFRIPAGQSGLRDIRDAIAHLADHPNVGPFMARLLIQRLVKSNPSPAYIERAAGAFDDDGSGIRGNLGAVIRAILMDDEARRDPGDPSEGRLREPFLRWVSFLRAFDISSDSGEFLVDGSAIGFLVQQHPLAAPSVFNFFQPNFAPNGPVRDAGLTAPEFQITTDAATVWQANLVTAVAFDESSLTSDVALFRPGTITSEAARLRLNFDDEIAVADDVDALLDRLDMLLTFGTLSERSRDVIRTMLITPGLEGPELRVRLAVHFILISPDYAVVR